MKLRAICETCEHWDSVPTDPREVHRRCKLANSGGQPRSSCFGVVDGEPGNSGTLSTGPEFGCVHWEEAEP